MADTFLKKVLIAFVAALGALGINLISTISHAKSSAVNTTATIITAPDTLATISPTSLSATSTNATPTLPYLTVNNTVINLEIADTEAKREHGLSDRTSLSKNTALLFVFDAPGIWGFWMKDMNFPIDMIWLDQNFKVVYIKENARPELYPEVYTNELPAQYVLETNVNFVQENGIKVGDDLSFTLRK